MLQFSLFSVLVTLLPLISPIRAFNTGYARVQDDSDKPLSIGYVRSPISNSSLLPSTNQPPFFQIVFPGFEPLDIWGPMEILFSLSGVYNMTLSTISFEAGPISARLNRTFTIGPNGTLVDPKFALNPTIMATHSFADAPELDVIIVPGGVGNFLLDNENNFGMEDFIASRFDSVKYVLSVCTGATTLARSGILNGLKATTNKAAWTWATDARHGANVTWVPNARWVENDKVWTSSGVAAGMDMMYRWLSVYYGDSTHVNEVCCLMRESVVRDVLLTGGRR